MTTSACSQTASADPVTRDPQRERILQKRRAGHLTCPARSNGGGEETRTPVPSGLPPASTSIAFVQVSRPPAPKARASGALDRGVCPAQAATGPECRLVGISYARSPLGQQERGGRHGIKPRARTVECSRLLFCRFLRGQRRLGSQPETTSTGSTPITPVLSLLYGMFAGKARAALRKSFPPLFAVNSKGNHLAAPSKANSASCRASGRRGRRTRSCASLR